MDIIINELSLSGQFVTKKDFFDNLSEVLPITKLMVKLELNLLKNQSFYTSQVTSGEKFLDIAHSQDNQVRKIKSDLLRLSSGAFWNDAPMHSCDNDTYTHNSNNICDTSLAEASQRDKVILSFEHNDYLNKFLKIKHNSDEIPIFNILDKVSFLDYIYAEGHIKPLEFCKNKFSNLNFDNIQENDGFDKLDSEQINEFISQFNLFSSMDWESIRTSDGLQYKPYSGNWFQNSKYADKNIHKFRITQKYRCFGYREENIFYVLMLETDHKISDGG